MDKGAVTLSVNVDCSQVDAAIKKAERLRDLMQEAKSLADDLASCEVHLVADGTQLQTAEHPQQQNHLTDPRLSQAKEVCETEDEEKVATLLATGKWAHICTTGKVNLLIRVL